MMHAFYMTLETPAGSNTENVFTIWRSRNHNVKMNGNKYSLNGNELGNVRRDIINKKRLNHFELTQIMEKAIANVKDIDFGSVDRN